MIDDNVITAQPWAYRDYAAAIAVYLELMPASVGEALATYTKRRRYVE